MQCNAMLGLGLGQRPSVYMLVLGSVAQWEGDLIVEQEASGILFSPAKQLITNLC